MQYGSRYFVLTAIVSHVLFKQALDTPAMIGIALIVSGVVVINIFSQSKVIK
jgi:small multidrug resistance pump